MSEKTLTRMALLEAVDDLWGCITEIGHLQPETIEVAAAVHTLLRHSDDPACQKWSLCWWQRVLGRTSRHSCRPKVTDD